MVLFFYLHVTAGLSLGLYPPCDCVAFPPLASVYLGKARTSLYELYSYKLVKLTLYWEYFRTFVKLFQFRGEYC